jgi:hypothetical protein
VGLLAAKGACLLAIKLLLAGFCTSRDPFLSEPDSSATATTVSWRVRIHKVVPNAFFESLPGYWVPSYFLLTKTSVAVAELLGSFDNQSQPV